MLRQACMDAAGWSRDVGVAVNLSPVSCGRHPYQGEGTRKPPAFPARRLELEITEIGAIAEQRDRQCLGSRLWRRGLAPTTWEQDIFAKETHSFSPFDKIKIDRSFVSELATRR